MTKYFLVGALVVILGAGYMSFVTKNKIVFLQGDIEKTKIELKKQMGILRTTEAELRKTKQELEDAKAEIERCNKEIAEHKAKIEGLEKDLTAARADIEEKGKTIEALNTEVARLKTIVGDTEGLKVTMDQLKEQLEKTKTELAESMTLRDALEKEKKGVEEKLATTERVVAEYKAGYVKNDLSGKVLAYNPGWNFVVLSLGDKQGLKMSAQMLVMRGNQAIAKVRVTSVEPAQSIADILPGSVVRGQTVQPGDTVVYEAKH